MNRISLLFVIACLFSSCHKDVKQDPPPTFDTKPTGSFRQPTGTIVYGTKSMTVPRYSVSKFIPEYRYFYAPSVGQTSFDVQLACVGNVQDGVMVVHYTHRCSLSAQSCTIPGLPSDASSLGDGVDLMLNENITRFQCAGVSVQLPEHPRFS